MFKYFLLASSGWWLLCSLLVSFWFPISVQANTLRDLPIFSGGSVVINPQKGHKQNKTEPKSLLMACGRIRSFWYAYRCFGLWYAFVFSPFFSSLNWMLYYQLWAFIRYWHLQMALKIARSRNVSDRRNGKTAGSSLPQSPRRTLK